MLRAVHHRNVLVESADKKRLFEREVVCKFLRADDKENLESKGDQRGNVYQRAITNTCVKLIV